MGSESSCRRDDSVGLVQALHVFLSPGPLRGVSSTVGVVLEGEPLVLAFQVVVSGGRINAYDAVGLIEGRLEYLSLALATFLLLPGLGSRVSFLLLLLGLACEGIVEQLREELEGCCCWQEFVGLEARGYCRSEILSSQELEDANPQADHFGRMRNVSFFEGARMPAQQCFVVKKVVARGYRLIGKTNLSKLGCDQ